MLAAYWHSDATYCVALELRKFIHPGIIEETMNGKLFFRSPVSTSTIAVRPFLKDNGRFADSFSLMVFSHDANTR